MLHPSGSNVGTCVSTSTNITEDQIVDYGDSYNEDIRQCIVGGHGNFNTVNNVVNNSTSDEVTPGSSK